MFVEESLDKGAMSTSFGLKVALGLSGVLTLVIGVYPEPFLQFAQTTLNR